MPGRSGLPEGFRFGVATSGFQTEGGYNGIGEPANNWLGWERAGKAAPSGRAVDFWERYAEHLDRAVAAGCNSFRLSVEWTRCEPQEGSFDDDAFARYAAILEACRERGLEPLVTLHHFTHPAWLGDGFWLDLRAPDRFAQWAETVGDRLGEQCRLWLTLNEMNAYALNTWVTGLFPPGERLNIAAAVRTLDHMLAAHVLAYEKLHARSPDAVVGFNTYGLSVYELDRLLTDLTVSRAREVERGDLREWLEGRRWDWYRAIPGARGAEAVARRSARTAIQLEMAFPRAVGEIYDSEAERCLDVIAFDHYHPVTAGHLRMPGRRTAGGRWWVPGRPLWDDPPDPDRFALECELRAEPGVDLWVAENGLANRLKGGTALPRTDGWTRPRYLEAHLRTIGTAVANGVPITGYWHWTLVDNYEWGSYEPRFGLYGMERSTDDLAWSDVDSLGDDSAGAFRRLRHELTDHGDAARGADEVSGE